MTWKKWIILLLLFLSCTAMKKTTDEELNRWRFRYPSAGVSWNFIGDQVSCLKFMGYAKIMLYQLKNRMNLAVPKLKSLQDKRSPELGTTIIVKSIYGQDFIEISTGVGVAGGKEICSITFIDVPLYVPPMRNPGEIKAGEVQGVDYFKTYYSIDVSKCSTCQEILWEFLFTYLQSSPSVPPTVPISTRVEWPIEPMHNREYDADGFLINDDVTDHTIYSVARPAWGEVISHGTDSKGTYIIWKAYTETALIGFDPTLSSRSGFGIMRLVARIKNKMGVEICAQNERIEVDCCLKDGDLRKVFLHDESLQFPGSRQWVLSGGNIYYLTPPEVQLQQLYWYAAFGSGAFWVLPEYYGGCLPFLWELSGPGTLTPSENGGTSAQYRPPQDWNTACRNQSVKIQVSDRCGATDVVITDNCCQGESSLAIGYTTLLMACSGVQNFEAFGGCPPYTWSVTSGSLNTPEGSYVEYTAPATNENCTSNPTVTLTDCCGHQTEIQLAVNCWSGGGTALQEYSMDGPYDCHCIEYYGDVCILWQWSAQYFRDDYDCDGNLLNHVESGYQSYMENCGSPSLFEGEDTCYRCCLVFNTCDVTPQCDQACGLFDVRTAAMKTGGCCPLNPLTGLPY